MSVPTREQLREHLEASRIAGAVATARENNLRNFRELARRSDYTLFGLRPQGRWDEADILALMAERVGVSPDPEYLHGPDRIDPQRTIERLDAMAERVARAARDRERVLVATGHPTGVLAIHLQVVRALQAAGARVLTPAAGTAVDAGYGELRHLVHLGGVAMLSSGGDLVHTHSAVPVRAMLADLERAGEPPPDLVVADHGFAGGAAQAGVDAVGFADCNDPALFVGEAEGLVSVAVPLDDNVLPHLYAPVTAYLLRLVPE